MRLFFGSAALALLLAPAPLPAQKPAITVVPQPDARLPLKHTGKATVPAITADDLMTRLYIFADDSMQGRDVGTAGNVRGAEYLAREARRIGLVPGGDSGTYFQTLPLMNRRVAPTSTMIAGATTLQFGREWAAVGNRPFALRGTATVFGGVVDDPSRVAPADSVQGKLVVLQLGRSGFEGLQAASVAFAGAAALAVIVPDQVIDYFAAPGQFLQNAEEADDGPELIFLSGNGASKIFPSRMTGLAPGAPGKAVEMNYNVEITPVQFPARNVVGILPGSDPALAGQYVAIGAHNDHVGMANQGPPVDHDSLRIFNHVVRPGGAEDEDKQAAPMQQARVNAELAAWRQAHPRTSRADSIFNGADDDGSGSVSVLEIAEKLVAEQPRPRRSIVFVWHVGEEKGLWGSEYFTEHPPMPRDSIVAQLNLDMVGRGNAWDVTGETREGAPLRGNPDYLQVVGSRRLSTELGDLAETVNREGKHGLVFDYGMDANGHPMNIYCRSDHYAYARFGIPVIFFTTGGHSDYHQVTDEAQYIDYPHMARIDNFIADLLMRVANRDHRILVDQLKPEPGAACVQ